MKTLFAKTVRSNWGFILLACGLIVSPRLNAGGNSPGKVMNVDFGPLTGPSQKAGPAATGQTSADFWNYYSRDNGNGGYRTSGGLDNMKWADGKVSDVGLSVANAPGCWGNGAADPMYNYYLYPLGPGNLTVVVTNLPPGAYDFYVYGHGDHENQNGVYQLSSGDLDEGTQSTAATGTGWKSPTWQVGQQYVVFRNVPVARREPVTITALRSPGGVALISGMQIAQTGADFFSPVLVLAVIFVLLAAILLGWLWRGKRAHGPANRVAG
ncbi:MAG: hypothetical protein ABSF38_07275 [Verrucomicrobiota bacterium]|jgi:hypothetical protein